MTTHPDSRTCRSGRAWIDGAAGFLRRIVSGAPPKSRRARERVRAGAPLDERRARSEAEIDQAAEDSFPASDPPSWSGSGL